MFSPRASLFLLGSLMVLIHTGCSDDDQDSNNKNNPQTNMSNTLVATSTSATGTVTKTATNPNTARVTNTSSTLGTGGDTTKNNTATNGTSTGTTATSTSTSTSACPAGCPVKSAMCDMTTNELIRFEPGVCNESTGACEYQEMRRSCEQPAIVMCNGNILETTVYNGQCYEDTGSCLGMGMSQSQDCAAMGKMCSNGQCI